jgi:dihydropyrimidinase/dihydroorotase
MRAGAGKREIALNGQIVFPGLIDPHIHFGLSDRFGYDVMEADFQYDSKDCLVGGVTTVATTTLIGREPLLSAFDGALRCASGRAWCDFKVTCVVNFPEQVREIPAVVKKGGVSYKFFTGYAGKQAEVFGMNKDGISTGMFHEACKAIVQSGGSAFPAIHAEDPYVRGILVDEIRKMGRSDYLVAWAETTPAWAERPDLYLRPGRQSVPYPSVPGAFERCGKRRYRGCAPTGGDSNRRRNHQLLPQHHRP